jgi:cytochrome c-type biogenesis protein CcmH/NrfF
MANPANPTPEDLQAEDLAQDIAGEMPSPYCPGRSIASCPTQAARELEEDILGLAKQGMDREQIESVLVDRFGKATMGQAHSPVVLVGIGLTSVVALAMIVHAARTWLRKPAGVGVAGMAGVVDKTKNTAAPSLEGVSRAELDRLEDELDNLKED